MSDSIANKETEKSVASTPESKEEFVLKKAYDEKSKDMHKFKEAYKKAQALNSELQSRIEAEERAKMEEKQQFEELYKKSEAEKASLLQQIELEKQQLLSQRRKSALKQELGNIKEAYLGLANIDSIEVNEDGTLNSESVRQIANAFKQEHPALIPSGNSSSINSVAAPIDGTAPGQKSVSDMTFEEAKEALKQLKANQ